MSKALLEVLKKLRLVPIVEGENSDEKENATGCSAGLTDGAILCDNSEIPTRHK